MGGVPFGDGLSTLSKLPLIHFERVTWDHCNGADCLTTKGFTFAKIKISSDLTIDVYNIHATVSDDIKFSQDRQNNLSQLLAFVKEHSEGNPLILMGDFNAHYAYELDNIKDFQQKLGLVDAWDMLQSNGNYPQVTDDFKSKSALDITDSRKSIDKVFYRNSKRLVFYPKNYSVEK